jgi:signal transduction histidine kinase
VSIRLRLTLIQAAILGIVLTAFAVVVYMVVARELDQRLDYTVYLSGLEAKHALNEATNDHGATIDPFALPDSPEHGGVTLYVQLVSADGTVLKRSDNLDKDLPVNPEAIRAVLSDERDSKNPYSETIDVSGERLAVYSAPWKFEPSPEQAMAALEKSLLGMASPASQPGSGETTDQPGQGGQEGPGGQMAVLQVAAAEPAIGDDLLRTGALLVGVVLAATAIAAWAGWRLVANALQPVDDMSAIVRDIGATADFSRRLPVPDSPGEPDEIGRLAQTFNQMLADLEEAFSTQRRFLADAAHELRTPLTVFRASAETWRRSDRAAEHEKDQAALTIAREADRMGRLVADLLTLARGDAGLPDARRPVQFDSIVVDVYRQARSLTDDVTLILAEFDQAMVSGDPDRLRQLVLNLVDNAIRYTPPGGSVTLELAQSPGWAILRVRDTGQGIPAEELPRIFDRFYRVDSARTRSSGGAGLGLTISQEIARAHGGRIEVSSQAHRGTEFTVYLPTITAESVEPGT